MSKQNLARITAEIDFNLIKKFKMKLLSEDIKYRRWLEIKIKEFLGHKEKESGKRQSKTKDNKSINKVAALSTSKDTSPIEDLLK